jgi:hypothetical protein
MIRSVAGFGVASDPTVALPNLRRVVRSLSAHAETLSYGQGHRQVWPRPATPTWSTDASQQANREWCRDRPLSVSKQELVWARRHSC